MTLEQKIGQLMFIGWQTNNAEDIVELIKKYNFGNIILFTRNIDSAESIKIICDKIQDAALKYNGIPALIAIDQEGGSIRRIYEGITRVPGHMAIGAASNHRPNIAFEIGSIIGEELKEIGINFVLAPVVDVNNNPYNPIIGIRSFSDKPLLVRKLGSDFSKGLQSKGVLSSFKHFLGHGNVTVDSHLDLPHLSLSLEELNDMELIPYKGDFLPDAIMTAHILYDKLDNRFPASISSKIINGLLREEIGYDGIVVTDCFEMDALQRAFSLSEAAVFSINASVDMIIVSHTFGKQLTVRNALISAFRSGEIKLNLLDKSLERIFKAKEKYTKTMKNEVNYNENQKIANECSLSSITIAGGKPFSIDENTIVIGVTNYLNSTAEDANIEKMDIAKDLGEEYNIPYYSIDNKNFNVNSILQLCKERKVILALADSHLTLVQKVLYTSLIQNENRIMLISLRTPYDLLELSKPECHICIYEYTRLSVNSLIKVLNGSEATGVLPVNIDATKNIKFYGKYKSLLIRKVVNQLNAQYTVNITLQSVADNHKVSVSHLSRLFKKEVGINFVKYLNGLRIEKAKNLITGSTLFIYEIGNLCGFYDVNYFSKLFKKMVGVTPIEYRVQFGYYDESSEKVEM